MDSKNSNTPFNPFTTPPPPVDAGYHHAQTITIIPNYGFVLVGVILWAIWKRSLLRVSHPYPRPEPPAAPVASRQRYPTYPPPSSLPPLKARSITIALYISVGSFLLGYIYSFYGVILFNDDRFLGRLFPNFYRDSSNKKDPMPFCDYFSYNIQFFLGIYRCGVIIGLRFFVLMCPTMFRPYQFIFTSLTLAAGVISSINMAIISYSWTLMGIADGFASQVNPLIIKEFVPEDWRTFFEIGGDIFQSFGTICAFVVAIYTTDKHDIRSQISWNIFQDILNLDFLILYIPIYFEARIGVDESYIGVILVSIVTMVAKGISSGIRTKRYDAGEMTIIVLVLLVLWGLLHKNLDYAPTLDSIGGDLKIVIPLFLIVAVAGFLKRDFHENVVPVDVDVAFSVLKKGLSTFVSVVVLFLFPPLGCRFGLDFLYGFVTCMVFLFFVILDFM